ncbi:Putative LOC100197594 [Caligus rogercresseyi]|uniref:LOC100197594 n=1 Tax=Caligus rogercresseyi TaxID=217165 RepID=A0A7T8GPS2_CALRO|nr:Putative LOC100197594 [Caligus rogercresseyi]
MGTFRANKVCVVLYPWHGAESWMSTTLSRPNFSSIQGKRTSSKMCTYSTVLILRPASRKRRA